MRISLLITKTSIVVVHNERPDPDFVFKLARIKERISHQHDNMNQVDSKLSDLEARIRTLELQGSSRGVVIGSIERFGWIAVSALIGVVAYFFRK